MKAIDGIILHKLSRTEAAKTFVESQKRSLILGGLLSSSAAVRQEDDPLKKMVLPMWRGRVLTRQTTFKGFFGLPTSSWHYDFGRRRFVRRTTVDWQRLGGKLGATRLDGFTMYAGLAFAPSLVHDAMGGREKLPPLQAFSRQIVPEDVEIDPFKVKVALAEEALHHAVEVQERSRIVEAVKEHHGQNALVRLDEFDVQVEEASLSGVYLAAYVLRPSADAVPQIMSAFDDKVRISGVGVLDPVRSGGVGMSIGMIAQTVLPMFVPALRGAKGLWIAGGLIGAGYSVVRKKFRKWQERRELDRAFEANAASDETEGDRWRQEYTEMMNAAEAEAMQDFSLSTEEEGPLEGRVLAGRVPRATLDILGIEMHERVTPAEVRRRFHAKLKMMHPDRGGTAEQTRNLIEAREKVLDALNL